MARHETVGKYKGTGWRTPQFSGKLSIDTLETTIQTIVDSTVKTYVIFFVVWRHLSWPTDASELSSWSIDYVEYCLWIRQYVIIKASNNRVWWNFSQNFSIFVNYFKLYLRNLPADYFSFGKIYKGVELEPLQFYSCSNYNCCKHLFVCL